MPRRPRPPGPRSSSDAAQLAWGPAYCVGRYPMGRSDRYGVRCGTCQRPLDGPPVSSNLPRPMRAPGALLLFATSISAAPLAAQTASPYVPLHRGPMPYVESLIPGGVIADPTPLPRPLKQADLVLALEAADTPRLGAAAKATVRQLLREFRPRVRGPRYRVELGAGLAAASYTMRDPLELGRGVPPRQAVRRGFASGTGQLLLAFGPFVAVSHPTVDTRLQYDPDWTAKNDNATRWEEGYVSGQWRHGEAFFGILDRNWGPSGIQGVLLSDDPYSMDHLYLSIGTERVQIAAIATQLDSRTDTSGAIVNRYMIYHRFWLRPRGRWTVALWEGSVISGVGRPLEPWYLNAATLGVLRQSATDANVNSFVGFDLERHARTTLFGQFMLDDIQLSRKVASDQKPTSYAFTVGAKGRLRSRAAAWTLFYTQVANLTYRNEDDLQVPLLYGLGTGRNFSDYDQATAKLGIVTRSGALLEPELTLLRQGEGDPRLPHPLVPDYPTTAGFLQGVVERTVRVALSGSYAPVARFGLRFDGGVHRISNYLHMSGQRRTQVVRSLSNAYRFSTQGALP